MNIPPSDKSESRSTKSETNSKHKNPKQTSTPNGHSGFSQVVCRAMAFGTFELGDLDLFRISCFEIRILEITIIRNLLDALHRRITPPRRRGHGRHTSANSASSPGAREVRCLRRSIHRPPALQAQAKSPSGRTCRRWVPSLIHAVHLT